MERIEGIFTQVPRSALPGEYEIPAGWFAISYWWVIDHQPKTDEEKKKFQKKLRRMHGRWFRIKNQEQEREIYRILRFSPNLQGSKKKGDGVICLDWPGWIELSDYEDTEKPLGLVLEEVGWWPFPRFVMSHPDPVFRLAGFLGLLSVALGLLSLILAL